MEVLRAFLVDFAGNNTNNTTSSDSRKTPPQLVESNNSNYYDDQLMMDFNEEEEHHHQQQHNNLEDDEEEEPCQKKARLDKTGAYLLVPLGGGPPKQQQHHHHLLTNKNVVVATTTTPLSSSPTSSSNNNNNPLQQHHSYFSAAAESTPRTMAAPLPFSVPCPLVNHTTTGISTVGVHNPLLASQQQTQTTSEQHQAMQQQQMLQQQQAQMQFQHPPVVAAMPPAPLTLSSTTATTTTTSTNNINNMQQIVSSNANMNPQQQLSQQQQQQLHHHQQQQVAASFVPSQTTSMVSPMTTTSTTPMAQQQHQHHPFPMATYQHPQLSLNTTTTTTANKSSSSSQPPAMLTSIVHRNHVMKPNGVSSYHTTTLPPPPAPSHITSSSFPQQQQLSLHTQQHPNTTTTTTSDGSGGYNNISTTTTTTAETTTKTQTTTTTESRAQQKRKRNAEQARKTRERKKQATNCLSLEYYALQRENEHLKSLVHSRLPNKAQDIIGECCYDTKKVTTTTTTEKNNGVVFQTTTQNSTKQLPQQNSTTSATAKAQLWRGSDFELIENLTKTRQSFCITDPRREDNPIVYASCTFLSLTGYTREEILGRNCRFLQGDDDQHEEAVQIIKKAVTNGTDATTIIRNYKRDGTPFWNHFFIAPLRDKQLRVINYVGVQTEISAPDQIIKTEEPNSSSTTTTTGATTTEEKTTSSSSSGKQQQQEEASQHQTTTTPATKMSTLTERLKALEEGRKEQTNIKTLFGAAGPVVPVDVVVSTDEMGIPLLPQGTTSCSTNHHHHHHHNYPADDVNQFSRLGGGESNNNDDDVLDWAELAETLEGEFPIDDADNNNNTMDNSDGFDIMKFDDFETFDTLDNNLLDDPTPATTTTGASSTDTDDDLEEQLKQAALLRHFALYPRELIQRTIRSELIGSLMKANGDTSDAHFLSALELLSKVFKQDTLDADINASTHSVLHGQWRSISRPPYHSGGCQGQNDQGDFVYTLGKTSFNMFQPSDLRTTIQSTMNKIAPASQQQQQQQQQGDKTTAAGSGSGCCVTAPWSLRRELAMEEGVNKNITILKSYDITAAMTFEPPGPYQEAGADSTTFPSPPSRLRATYKVQGYFLPDPQVPNRLTVWFTGGQLAPAFHNCASPEQQQQQQDDEGKQKQQEQQYGDLNAWMELFGAEHRRSWGEALGLMGAKLFLGADLPDGMEPDGTMSYSLHRPYGGHGKGYVDVLYADQDLLITKGNSGTLHVMISNN